MADCDLAAIPAAYIQNGVHRSVRFRYSIPDNQSMQLEQAGDQLIAQSGCAVSDWRDYDFLGDLGGDRFVGEDRSAPRRQIRADLMAHFFHRLSELMLDQLLPAGQGGFRLETNNDRENPHGRTTESVLHMFCNISDVPTFVTIGTRWNPFGVELPIKF